MRFGYDGADYAGWARQPGRRTIEGEIRLGLARVGVVRGTARLEVASRTDRGVSARANALTVSSELTGPELLDRLNRIDPRIFFTAATRVSDAFRVRRALRRTYRYYEPGGFVAAARVRAAARLFAGTIDVRSFGRGVPGEEPVWRPVDSVSVRTVRGGAVVEVRARSFVWGMVRKIVAALREVDAGRLPVPRLRAAVEGRSRLTLPMAEPEPLVLWTVECGIPWESVWRGPSRHQVGRAQRLSRERWARGEVLRALSDGGRSDRTRK